MAHLLYMLAQQDNNNAGAAGSVIGAGFGCCFMVAYFAMLAVVIVGMWKVFVKARQPGWAAIIPIFNVYILCLMARKPGWWVILFLIPFVNVIVGIIVCIELAKYFGKGIGFALGLIFFPFIFFLILGFGTATYSGPAKPFTLTVPFSAKKRKPRATSREAFLFFCQHFSTTPTPRQQRQRRNPQNPQTRRLRRVRLPRIVHQIITENIAEKRIHV